jgi:hypothetical protein
MCIVVDPRAEKEEDKIVVTYSISKGITLHQALLSKYNREVKPSRKK